MLKAIIFMVVIAALAACTATARPTPIPQPAPTGAVEVQELVRRVVDGQQGRREVQGVIVQGTVSSTRVDWPIDGPRTYYADVEVLGRGGRVHTMTDCATAIPLRVGDPVVLSIPHGDPRQGCFVSGTQTPRRPLIFDEAPLPQRISDTRYRIGSIPYRVLGWPQAYSYDIRVEALVAWFNDSTRDTNAPAQTHLDLEIVLETDAGNSVSVLHLSTADADPDMGVYQWSGQYQLDDVIYPIRNLDTRIAFYVDVESHMVKWTDGASWLQSPPTLLTLSVSDPRGHLLVTELGQGTY